MGLHLVEDRPTPSSVYNWRVYLSAAVAGSAAIMIGYDSAFIGGAIDLDSFKDEFGLNKLSKSALATTSANIVSCYQAGAFFGAFFAYPFAYFYGRKKAISIFAAVFVLGAGLMLGATPARGLGLIYGGRVLAGIGVGGTSMISPIYISEVAPPAIRGRLVGFYEFSWQIGGLVGVCIYHLFKTKALLTCTPVLDQLRSYTDHGAFTQTMAHPFRYPADSRRMSLRWRLLPQRVTPMALYPCQARGRHCKSVLDSPA